MSDNYRPGGLGRFSMFPPVLKFLLITNLVIFGIEAFFGSLHLGDTILKYFFADYLYLHPLDGNFFAWQLVSYQFFHGGFWHLFMNLFALWMFGAELEVKWGSNRFLVFYLLSGVGGGLLQVFSPYIFNGTAAVTLGASGSVFGVLVAFGMTFPNRPIFMFPIFIPIPAKFFVIGYALINVLLGFSGSQSGDKVAYFAHIGGAVAGFLLFKFGEKLGIFRFFERLGGRKGQQAAYSSQTEYRDPYANVYQARWEMPKAKKSEEERKPSKPINVDGEEITQAKINEILDKISETGYQNLTDREKQILFELSRKLR